jgi:hypothetical protein
MSYGNQEIMQQAERMAYSLGHKDAEKGEFKPSRAPIIAMTAYVRGYHKGVSKHVKH